MLKNKKGFTLMEMMINVAIIGIIGVGLVRLFADGMYMWNMGSARVAMASEARMTMVMLKKLIEECQGSSISIARYDAHQPANSYLEAVVQEAVYVTTTQANCGCGTQSTSTTVGGTGAPVQIFQFGSSLLCVFPYVDPGTDMTSQTQVNLHTHYSTLTISASVDSLMFSYADSPKGTIVNVGARFSRQPMKSKPPIYTFLNDTIVVKHMHSAGYYYN
jgi:prepilin-type N-terminal cleavage/methylation domain-containing protein